MKKLALISICIITVILVLALTQLIFQKKPTITIESIELVEQNQHFIVKIKARNQTETPELKLTIIDPEGRRLDTIAKYSNGAWTTDPLPITSEGFYNITVHDAEDNPINSSKIAIYTKPRIQEVNCKVTAEDIQFNVTAEDISGIKLCIIQINDRNYTLTPIQVDQHGNGLWSITISIDVNTVNKSSYTIHVLDPYNKTTTYSGEILFTKIEIIKSIARSLKVSGEIVDKLASIDRNLLYKLLDENITTLKILLKAEGNIILYDQIARDKHVHRKIEVLSTALSFNATPQTIQSAWLLGNLSNAYIKGLPKHDHGLIRSVINACNLYPELGNFTPIIITDVLGNVVVVGSVNVTRDVWMLFEFVRRCNACGYDLLSRPEAFEAVNAKIVQNAWDILDNPYGPGYYDKVAYGPTDEGVWRIIMMQWSYYADPYFKGVNRSFYYPILDSREARMWINSSTGRKLAIMALWRIPAYAVDLESGKKVFGLKGMETFVKQLGKIYDEVMGLYPNGTVGRYNLDPRNYYFSWIDDRAHHGLMNTVKQFLGLRESDTWSNEPELRKLVKQRDGIHQYLSKIFPKWDLVVFAYGYTRWDLRWPGEAGQYTFGIPQTFAALGIPYTTTCINPTPLGTMPGEWAVTLLDSVVNALKQRYGDSIVIGVANTFGLYNCKDGLFKDGIKEIGQGIRRNPIYLAVKS